MEAGTCTWQWNVKKDFLHIRLIIFLCFHNNVDSVHHVASLQWMSLLFAYSNSSWGTNTVPLVEDRAHITDQIYLFPGVCVQTQPATVSANDEMHLSSTAVSDLSTACSMPMVQQQKKIWCRYVDATMAWLAHQTMKHPMQISNEIQNIYWLVN